MTIRRSKEYKQLLSDSGKLLYEALTMNNLYVWKSTQTNAYVVFNQHNDGYKHTNDLEEATIVTSSDIFMERLPHNGRFYSLCLVEFDVAGNLILTGKEY